MFVTREQLFAAMPAADPIAHYLVVLEGTSPGKRLEIDTAPITIGRGAPQTLVCDDRDVSRQHARVSLVNGDGGGRGPAVDQRHLRRRGAHHRRR